jgi:hypothetical protein
VAVEPAAMVAAAVLKTGGAVDPVVALSISNCKTFDTTPPEAGVCTVIGIVPAVTVSEAGTCVTSWLPLTNRVASGVAPRK